MSAQGKRRPPAALRKRRRLYGVVAGLTMISAAAALVLVALEDNIVFFHIDSIRQTSKTTIKNFASRYSY